MADPTAEPEDEPIDTEELAQALDSMWRATHEFSKSLRRVVRHLATDRQSREFWQASEDDRVEDFEIFG